MGSSPIPASYDPIGLNSKRRKMSLQQAATSLGQGCDFQIHLSDPKMSPTTKASVFVMLAERALAIHVVGWRAKLARILLKMAFALLPFNERSDFKVA
jgi:hypothetical protein